MVIAIDIVHLYHLSKKIEHTTARMNSSHSMLR